MPRPKRNKELFTAAYAEKAEELRLYEGRFGALKNPLRPLR
jgi:hypothetical protein